MIRVTSRERFLGVMTYSAVDRPVYRLLMGGWPETIKRWKSEGYDPASEPLFPTDDWRWYGDWFFPNPPFERQVLEEDDKTVLYVNHEGILMRERKDNPYSSMPQFVRFPVETRDDFRRFCAERMQPDLVARLGPEYGQFLSSLRARDYPLICMADRWGGFFGPLRNLMGVERLCMAFYDTPALVEEMMDFFADFIIAMMDRILQHTDVDVFGFWEDMAYKTGPLISPEHVRRYMLPRYVRVVDFLRSRGVGLIQLDSDGQVEALLPVWMDAGIDLIYPFEVQCGMDVVAARRKYGRGLLMYGGIDKRALARGREAIDAEIARVRPLLEEGGYVASPDHSLPPDVSFDNYRYFMERLGRVTGALS